MKIIFSFVIICFCFSQVNGQLGTIKGTVQDQQSEVPLMGATVELLDMESATGTVTDINGKFVLKQLPVGRYRIRVSYIGFESAIIPNIEVTSGKDVFLTIALRESLDQLDEIVLSNNEKREKPINELATVSARQFGLEEVTRFSGGRGDVGRLAANFAGVSTPDDSRNDIVIRGNSPSGLLWRLEGIPIPNPNHFSAFGTTGGPVSAVNSNVLKNSDFFTSAFPAEYGNALAGVFDLGFRQGNPDDYEFTGQVGAFTGVELMGEGPLNNKNGSFLIAARYSLVGLVGAGAGGASSATPNYGDLSFNIYFGKSALGSFSLFGILGTSDIDFLGDETDGDDLFAAEDEDLFVRSNFGVIGLKHRIQIGKQSFLRTVISVSQSESSITSNRFIDLDTPQERSILFTETDDSESRISISSLFNSKINKKITLRAGALLESFNVTSLLRDREEQADIDGDGDPDLFTFRDSDERFSIVQPYVQFKWRLSKKIDLTAGAHALYSNLNNQFVIEPRAGIQYQLNDNQNISFGYGLHHQPVPFPLLFLGTPLNNGATQTNSNLDFVRSNQFVLGYTINLGNSWSGKLEAYYQNISNAAVEAFPSSYSSLTEGADFVFDNDRIPLVNEGTGFNRGVELTLEKLFSQGYYGLLTTSVFESRYEGSDGIERNTPFNNGFVINFLTGKEFPTGASGRNKFFIDTRFSIAGGRFFTPVDLEASQAAGFEVLQEDLAFSEQYDNYLRWDLKFGIKLNSKRKKQSHQFFIDLQNVTNRENVFVQRFNRLTNEVNQIDQVGFFPDVGYKFQF